MLKIGIHFIIYHNPAMPPAEQFQSSQGRRCKCRARLETLLRGPTQQRRTQKIFMGVIHSEAYGGHLHLVCAVCDVTI